MILSNGIEIDKSAVLSNINRITNLIFKILPIREEGGDWRAPLQTVVLELTGAKELLQYQVDLFPLICKLEVLKQLDGEDDFLDFRKTIFECLGIMGKIKSCLD